MVKEGGLSITKIILKYGKIKPYPKERLTDVFSWQPYAGFFLDKYIKLMLIDFCFK